jgi:hypothetical protein
MILIFTTALTLVLLKDPMLTSLKPPRSILSGNRKMQMSKTTGEACTDLLLPPPTARAENHQEVTLDPKVVAGNRLLVEASLASLVNASHSTNTRTKAATGVDHDHRRLLTLKGLLPNHHREAEHHRLIGLLEEHHLRRVLTAKHLADSSLPATVPTTNVAFYTSAVLEGVDLQLDVQLHRLLLKRETKIIVKVPNLLLHPTFATFMLRGHALTETDVNLNTKSYRPLPLSRKLKLKQRLRQPLYVLEYPGRMHQP